MVLQGVARCCYSVCYGVARWLCYDFARMLLGGCYGVARCCCGVARWLQHNMV